MVSRDIKWWANMGVCYDKRGNSALVCAKSFNICKCINAETHKCVIYCVIRLKQILAHHFLVISTLWYMGTN